MKGEGDTKLAGIDGPSSPIARMGRWLPLLLIVVFIVSFFSLGLHRYLTFQALADNSEWLHRAVSRLGFLAAVVFIVIYAFLVAVSVPVGAILTLTGGYLFGTWLGGLYSLIAATTGATIIFLIARTSLGVLLRRRAGPFLRKAEAGFQENAASYLLVLRLVPILPFWVVNLVPAFLGVPLRTFIACSVLGMVPATFIYAGLGEGVGAVIAMGQSPDLKIIFQLRVLGPLLALALFALIPVAYKRLKRGQPRAEP